MGSAYRVVADLDGREGDVLAFPVGTNFGDNGLYQLTVLFGFRVYTGTRLESQSNINPVPL